MLTGPGPGKFDGPDGSIGKGVGTICSYVDSKGRDNVSNKKDVGEEMHHCMVVLGKE